MCTVNSGVLNADSLCKGCMAYFNSAKRGIMLQNKMTECYFQNNPILQNNCRETAFIEGKACTFCRFKAFSDIGMDLEGNLHITYLFIIVAFYFL